jgi:hypothetical protein
MISAKKLLTETVFEPGAEGGAARSAFGRAYSDVMKREWFTIGVHLGYRYDESPLIISDGSPPPSDPPMTYSQTARPGGRAPHVWLSPGVSTLDLFGRGFTLLRFDTEIEVASFEMAARRPRLPLRTVDIDDAGARRLYACALALVRPDGFVAWRGDAPPSDPGRVVDRARGAA